MAQEIGRVERPSADQYQGKRKLLLVPLMHTPPTDSEEGTAILEKYWDQVRTQIAALESRLGSLRHIYCESLIEGGVEGLKNLELIDQRSHSFVKTKHEGGATLQATEDKESLAEILDLQRFLVLPMVSQRVAHRIHEWFAESNKSRYQHIADQINETLGENETGLLLISERHQVQFPADIEVFYVAPPALDELRRWLQNWMAQQRQGHQEEGDMPGEEEEGEPG
jgi:hypothetical protein